jgi:glycosyltransferase involved in cell wall biosynthesis
MATGTPVIAYGKWWALETVVDGETGIFFSEQTSNSLNESIKIFEQSQFDSKKIRRHAERFDKAVFREKLLEFVEDRV